MADTFDGSIPGNPAAGQRPVPQLSLPPRSVPASIQWQMVPHQILLVIGGVFVAVPLLVFIVPQLAAGNRFESPWQLFPFLHLSVGLGMVIGPLVAWRRSVAVLKWGYLAPARIVAIQDQGTDRRPGEESYEVRNLAGPWLDYNTALAQARRFPTSKLPTAPQASFDVARFALGGMGCFLTVAGPLAVLFMGLWLVSLWLSDNPAARKVEGTLFIVGFTAAYLGAIWLMRRWFMQVKRFATGALSMGHIGVRPTVRARFVFSTPEGHETEVEAYIDLRPHLERSPTSPEDLVV